MDVFVTLSKRQTEKKKHCLSPSSQTSCSGMSISSKKGLVIIAFPSPFCTYCIIHSLRVRLEQNTQWAELVWTSLFCFSAPSTINSPFLLISFFLFPFPLSFSLLIPASSSSFFSHLPFSFSFFLFPLFFFFFFLRERISLCSSV